MPSKRDAQLVSDGSSDKKVKEATSQVDTKEGTWVDQRRVALPLYTHTSYSLSTEVIAAQLQALEHIKRVIHPHHSCPNYYLCLVFQPHVF